MRTVIAVLLLAAAGWPQAAPKRIVDDGPPDAYLFPFEQKAKLRDLQYQGDQLEIQNQKLLLEIEKNKARQAALEDAMKAIAYDYAVQRHIDLSLYQLDAVQMKFTRKKP